jgi:hypothetical protein
MAGFSTLALGAAIGAGVGGFFLGRRRKQGERFGTQPVLAPTPTPVERRTPAQQVAATNPPSVVRETAASIAQAKTVAQRTRRRAAAGSAGRVSTGTVSPSQRSIRTAGAPATLLGF